MLYKRTYENGAANKRSLSCLTLEQATKVRPEQSSLLPTYVHYHFIKLDQFVMCFPAIKCVNVNIDLQKVVLVIVYC